MGRERVLTVACGPTGVKRGIWSATCGGVIVPVRARLFLVVMVKSNMGLIITVYSVPQQQT